MNDLVVSQIKDGIYQYELVSGFFHRSENTVDMLRLRLQNNITMDLSANHLAYIYEDGLTTKFVSDLQVGDRMIYQEYQYLQILQIDQIQVDGFVAPITESGKILINHIQMSVYANINQPFMTQIVMKPYHWIIRFIDSKSFHYESKGETRNIYASILQTFYELFVQ